MDVRRSPGWRGEVVFPVAATGAIPPGVSVVLSKPPRVAELRQSLAEIAGS